MARTNFRIDGLAELDQALTELPRATARNVLVRVLKKAGQPIADMGAALAPKLSGRMARSYSVSTKLSRSQKKSSPKQSMVEVYIGPAASVESIQTEFGNAHQAAEPHLRPAWDAGSGPAMGSIKGDLTDELAKAAKRAAAKAARILAKMKA